MDRNSILEKIGVICRDIFEDEELVIIEATSSKDVDGWDSLVNMSIINEIENTFHIEFSLGDMQNSKNVGQLIDVVSAHLTEKK